MARAAAPSQRTEDERLAIRREKVRLNVQAHRERQRLKKRLEDLDRPCQPKLRWIQETKWQSKGTADSRDQDQVEESAGPRSERPPKAECRLTMYPSPEKQYTLGLLALFRTRLLPDRVTLRRPGPSEQRLTTPCAPWVVRGYELAAVQENPLLTGMLRALGLAFVGAEHQREDIQSVARRTYQVTIQAVSRKLRLLVDGNKPSTNDYSPLMLSCHAGALFELNVSGSLPGMSRHVRGLGCLLISHFLEAKSMPQDISDILEEYRLLEMVFCLINRQPSVLSGTTLSKEAKRPDNPDLGDSHMSQLTKLVHIAGEIPPIMVYVDGLNSGTVISDQEVGRLSTFLETLSYTTTELQTWAEDFLANDAHSVAESLVCTSRNSDLTLPNLEVLTPWTFYLSIKICALETYISMLEHDISIRSSPEVETVDEACSTNDFQLSGSHEKILLLRSEVLETTRLLLRSVPYFSQPSLGYIGRSLVAFPLETTKRALLHEFERRAGQALAASEIAGVNFSYDGAQDIIQDLIVWKEIATSAKASGCALFSH
ncbi:uncharacterized protein Z520_03978 [Fonsecaea multimorphosa CBS 102226]|uniref:Uncharacterized protein n=1 Tax=Fonsecaea multimorphosa CBS 102226 TaxID=1442371 RepID=A0A0D2K386_9EURO|nr:uncharacterized protein Z520_03978 [Fonsecaea multimorphosa CBS 102226]KIY00293.1 hypothetical protein Z520_03978 [Fonsecaea multimorphosa CBS 102226]OAL27126.1 hypothetical protein AYO22_03757 [Fonsecaea multimorphosa]